MKNLLGTLCISMAVLTLSVPAAYSTVPPPPPPLIHMAAGPRTEPVWVAAEAAAAPNQAKSSAECSTVFGAPVVERLNPKPNQTFKDLKDNAIGAYSGHVVNIIQGFFDGLPASLLHVEVENRLRSARSVHQGELWVVYPYARFQIGDVKFCTGVESMDHPAIGDRILVFVYGPPLDAGRKLIVPEPQEIFFEKAEGGLRLPKELAGDPELGTARTLDQIERALAVKPEGHEH